MAFWRPWEAIPSEDSNLNRKTKNFHIRNKHMHVQSQHIILNIYNRLKRENLEQCNYKLIQRISKLTEVSVSTIYRITKDGVIDHNIKRKEKNKKFHQIDDGDTEVIRRIVYNFYKENKVPTLEMLREKLLNHYPDYKYKSLETLRGILQNVGLNI
ncbi:hypothetical protein ABEB36_014513 [Hypothenemus hampei]|uniref:Uncharacterized protein n=1 Tax=Hypothenemus hampei TaxID=57062 RepID=A0ABD1E2A6_HYPHA